MPRQGDQAGDDHDLTDVPVAVPVARRAQEVRPAADQVQQVLEGMPGVVIEVAVAARPSRWPGRGAPSPSSFVGSCRTWVRPSGMDVRDRKETAERPFTAARSIPGRSRPFRWRTGREGSSSRRTCSCRSVSDAPSSVGPPRERISLGLGHGGRRCGSRRVRSSREETHGLDEKGDEVGRREDDARPALERPGLVDPPHVEPVVDPEDRADRRNRDE